MLEMFYRLHYSDIKERANNSNNTIKGGKNSVTECVLFSLTTIKCKLQKKTKVKIVWLYKIINPPVCNREKKMHFCSTFHIIHLQTGREAAIKEKQDEKR